MFWIHQYSWRGFLIYDCYFGCVSYICLQMYLLIYFQRSSGGLPAIITSQSFINFVFHNDPHSQKQLFEELGRIWMNILAQKVCTVNSILILQHERTNDTFKFSWFIFGIMHKSMTLKLHETGELYGEIAQNHWLVNAFIEKGKSRTERFSKDFVGTLKKLISSLVLQIRDKIQSSFTVANLNINIALFLKDLLAIMDRGVVFQLVIWPFEQLTQV